MPVLLSVAGWDPAERIEAWCARRIAQDYPDFLVKGSFSPQQVTTLLLNRHIVPVLDGLDEMPRPVLSTALADLDRAAEIGLRMVLTCRSAEYEQAVQDRGALAHAAVVDIEPIQVEDTIAYLTEAEVANTHRWSAVIEQMRKEPSGPLAQALSTPLMISLARSVYRPSIRDPEKLTEFTTTPQITNHLLEEYLPTVFTDDDHKKAKDWLSFLSRHLQEKGGPNFEWWHLARAVPRWMLISTITLVSMMCGSILLILYFDAITGAIVGATVGILGGLRTARSIELSDQPGVQSGRLSALRDTFSDIRSLATILCLLSSLILLCGWISDQRFSSNISHTIAMALFELRTFDSQAWLAAIIAAILALQVTLIINFTGFRAGAPKSSTPIMRHLPPSLMVGMILGLTFAAVWFAPTLINGNSEGQTWSIIDYFSLATIIGIPTGIGRWLAVPVEEHKANSPLSLLRGDRTSLLTAALASGVLTALAGTLLERNWAFGLGIGLLIMMVVVVGSGSTWLSYTIARLWLACQGKLPWRLMRFLCTAHEKGVLRQVGPAYQLRHELLRTHLAEQRASVLDSSQPRVFTPHGHSAIRRSRSRVRPWLHDTGALAAAVLFMGTISVLYFDDDVIPIGRVVNAVEFSPNNHTLAIAAGQQIHLRNLENKSSNRTIDTHAIDLEDVTFGPDGTTLATASHDSTTVTRDVTENSVTEFFTHISAARLWDITTDEPATEPFSDNNVEHVEFSPDGTTLASGGDDSTAQLWDITTDPPTLAETLPHNGYGVNAVAFSPDGTTLATGSNDGTARLWNITTGEAAILEGHREDVTSVAFNHDGTTLATGSNDGTARLWDVRCEVAMADLPQEQRQACHF
ncbi:WD40 repeat domain-containing protein [Nocardiopsis tropica]|nr:WD40 repeat domain-containing protein [Nocardiopsis tropica]